MTQDNLPPVNNELGKHYLLDFVGCSAETISSVTAIQNIMLAAAKESQSTILSHDFHQFSPHGVSGYIFIAESHFSIHTWPEEQYAAVDIFTCGPKMLPEVAIASLKVGLKAQEIRYSLISRGI